MKKKKSDIEKLYYYERTAAVYDIVGKKWIAKYYKFKYKRLQKKIYKERMM